MLPVRKDILNNLSLAFNEGWVGDIFKTSVDQITLQFDQNKVVTVPLVKEYPRVAQNYVDAWYKHCVEYDEAKEGVISSAKMKDAVTKDFASKEKGILGSDYPVAAPDTAKK